MRISDSMIIQELEENYAVDIDDLQAKRYLFVGIVNTKGILHAMFYKDTNSPVYKKVPSVMCNTKNIDRIYYDIDRQLDFD